MKKNLLLLMLFASVISYEALGQCGRVGLIGEFTGWSSDYFMTRNPETPELFTVILTVNASDDPNTDGIVEMKFRANSDWATNWGAADFPSGTATPDGPNIPVPYGSYLVTFNCNTGAYNFLATCGNIGLIGEFNGWAADEWMTRNMASPDNWTTVLILTAASDPDANGIVELKFRANSDWATNWGSADFPSGTATQDGPNIPVPVGSYVVTFNCATGVYNFLSTCGNIALIGEFNGWGDDFWMTRKMTAPDEWSVILPLNADSDPDANGIVEMKFRMNSDWGTNWGAADFPSGIGLPGGANIPVPLDGTGLTTDYLVTFNCATGAYSFTAASGPISMIGAFNNWNGDVPMNRDAVNPNLWKLSRSWFANSEVKFRENKDWGANWGNNTFPTGTGTPNGPNIPLVAGKYDVTFNSTSFEYSFVANSSFCGEIGMIGDFNEWGGDPSAPTDVWMLRDPVYPSQFMIEYNFTSSTQFLFRLDADATFSEVWGGTFPEGTGVKDPSMLINVPGGKYMIYFNCKSGDFNFVRLGNAVIAPKVFAMSIDGSLSEPDWRIDQVVSQVINGEPIGDPNEVYFGVTYNEEYLFIGIDVSDAVLTGYEIGEVFIDGNKSGGAYDEFDAHLRFGAGLTGAYINVIYPDTIEGILLGFIPKPAFDGFTAELAIPWAGIGVTAAEGNQIGFDIILGDSDSPTGEGFYQMAWNGGLQNYVNTSSFGDLLFGTLSCGCISLYNEVVGDVILRNPTDQPTNYVGSYELFENQGLLFRKDMNSAVTWGANAFPEGTAALNGPVIPATTGRYRVAFNCLTGAYTFTNNPAGDNVAYTQYTDTPPVIDGNLSEYNLMYDSQILAAGAGPINNTVTWGSRWDQNNLYFGVKVVDAVVEGSGNPWDNDAIEYYIDGNNDKDGTYDSDFDTQLIQDFFSNSTVDTVLWVKADGVPVTNYTAKWLPTTDGYNVELRLGWDNFSFSPGKGRMIGFSLGNNDSDKGLGRDYQTVWYGDGNNWSNTSVLGDLQLEGGPLFFNIGDIVDYSSQIVLFPNPSSGNVYLRMVSDSFSGKVTLHVADIAGRTIVYEKHNLDTGNMISLDAHLFTPGMYFVTILGDGGAKAVKKLIIK
jgi:hypothetical protein